MARPRLAPLACAALAAAGLARPLVAQKTDVEAAFRRFWDARTPQAAAAVAPAVVATGVSFDQALQRLRRGRPYSADVPRGVVRTSYDLNGVEYFYAINVPDSYDPARRYQVRVQLHGGVGRASNQPRGDGTIGSLAGVEQFYIVPYAWRDAPWWSDEQLVNLRTILDRVKRRYNVDENRVALAGVSDGGSGAFYVAMRDATPYASFLSLNGFLMVLRSVAPGDLFAHNLRNKPFFVVNGGADPLYPTRIVGPYVDHLRKSGIDVVYRPQPEGAHNTAWWPEVRDSFEEFVSSRPRNPLPDTLTWESGGMPIDNRISWLIIDETGPRSGGGPALDDVNLTGLSGNRLFDVTEPSGRVDLARTGNTVKATTRGVARFTLLISPDRFDLSQPVRVETDGRIVFDGIVEPNLETMLKWAARDNDRTMLFAAELHVSVPRETAEAGSGSTR